MTVKISSSIQALSAIARIEFEQCLSFTRAIGLTPAPQIDQTVYWTGLENRSNVLIRLYGLDILLTSRSHRLLLILALAAAGHISGRRSNSLVNHDQLDRENTHKYVHRMHKEIAHRTGQENVQLARATGDGHYVYTLHPNSSVFNFSRLSTLGDAFITTDICMLTDDDHKSH